MDSRCRFLTSGTPWTQSMPSRDVNAVTRLAEASWWRDNDNNGHLNIPKYDKCNDFNFQIIIFFSWVIPFYPAYGVFISQFIRYARAFCNITILSLQLEHFTINCTHSGVMLYRARNCHRGSSTVATVTSKITWGSSFQNEQRLTGLQLISLHKYIRR